jgi:hypothetical protein
MPTEPYVLSEVIKLQPSELRRVTLGTFGPGEPPEFKAEYRKVSPPGSVSLHKERINVGKGRYLLVYMFQSYAVRTSEIIITREPVHGPSAG